MVLQLNYSRWNGYLSDHLEHHGIKGQQWGVRRFQNEDGTLTEEGMRRYGIVGDDGKLRITNDIKNELRRQNAQDNSYKETLNKEKQQNKPISKRRQQLIDDYKKQGLTQEQAEVSAYKRESMEKFLKITAAVALTAAVAYGAYKGRQWLLKNGDQKIKAGTDIFRTTKYSNEDLNRAGYVADNARDAEKYVGAYGAQIHQNKAIERFNSALLGKKMRPDVADDNIYQITGKAAQNIKVAGDRKANKVFQRLLKNDKEFAADNETIKSRWGDTGDSYSDFNKRLVDHEDAAAERVQKKFYDALKQKGYGGLIDSNDRDNSGYHVKKPVILFNMKDNLRDVNIRSIRPEEVQQKYPEAINLMRKQAIGDITLKQAMKSVRNSAGYGAAGAGLALFSVKSNDRATIRRGAYQQSIIRQYKKEHPATKLSDAQILENELGGNDKRA